MEQDKVKKLKWFWSWQDEKEEAWLEKMSREGLHLESATIPCNFTFTKGESTDFTYRLDYILLDKTKVEDYIQLFQDAGWEYVCELSNWRYWRKPATAEAAPEIFTDTESKLRKYQRLLGIFGFFLIILFVGGRSLFTHRPWLDPDDPPFISSIYLAGAILYAVVIPLYVVGVIQLLRRINQIKKNNL